jgi:hypothetical protein
MVSIVWSPMASLRTLPHGGKQQLNGFEQS